MSSINRTLYWTLIRLDSQNGDARGKTIPEAQAFFEQMFPESNDTEFSQAMFQKQLFAIAQSGRDPTQQQLARLCLRCFISHQIEKTCKSLEQRFGIHYGFNRRDLYAIVLDDDGRLECDGYQPLSNVILQKYDPQRGQLSTWTNHLVKQHRELNTFLLNCGLYLLSDWGILNDTTLQQLREVLGAKLASSLVQREVLLLECYQAIYRQERLQQRQAGVRGKCPAPTPDQLQRISQAFQQATGQLLPPDKVLLRLESLASMLRQERIATRQNRPPSVPLEDSKTAAFTYEPSDELTDEPDRSAEFLDFFRQGFQQCLATALKQVIEQRLPEKPQKAQAFLKALRLFHCDGKSMTEIAPEIGLKAQYQVTRLLKLENLRADVRHYMIRSLKEQILQKVEAWIQPDRLKQLDQQLDELLGEQVDSLIQEAAAAAKTVKQFTTDNRLYRSVCECVMKLEAN